MTLAIHQATPWLREIAGPNPLVLMVVATVTMKMPSVTRMKFIPIAPPVGVFKTRIVLKVVTMTIMGIGIAIS